MNDSLIVITPGQLKKTNLIFLEHSKLKLENSELHFQINQYECLVDNYILNDSINNNKITLMEKSIGDYQKAIESNNKTIDKLQFSNKIYKGIVIGSVGVSIGLLTLFLIK